MRFLWIISTPLRAGLVWSSWGYQATVPNERGPLLVCLGAGGVMVDQVDHRWGYKGWKPLMLKLWALVLDSYLSWELRLAGMFKGQWVLVSCNPRGVGSYSLGFFLPLSSEAPKSTPFPSPNAPKRKYSRSDS